MLRFSRRCRPLRILPASLILLLMTGSLGAITIDGTLHDWTDASRVAGCSEADIDIYLTADATYVYVGVRFAADTTDARNGDSWADSLTGRFGVGSDGFAAPRYELIQTSEPINPAYRTQIDGYTMSWREAGDLNGDGSLDDRDVIPFMGAEYQPAVWADGIQAATAFGPTRCTEWAVPLTSLGASAGDVVFIHLFAESDRYGQFQQMLSWPDYNDWSFAGFGDEMAGLAIQVPVLVPEPTTAMILAGGGLSLLLRRRSPR